MSELKEKIDLAAQRIHQHIRKTPLEPAHSGGQDFYLKLECLQKTRSFKLRGALNKLLSLSPEQLQQGVITASTGNHGLAVAFGLDLLQAPGKIVLPETAAPKKVALLERYNVELVFHGQDSATSETYARQLAAASEQPFISPYNDWEVVAGQGTIGIELCDQLPGLQSVYVPVGGGGLISGIAGYLKAVVPDVEIVGCIPAHSPVMHECVEAGKIVAGTVEPTLSDGTAGGVEDGAITFPLCRDLVDRWVRVSEAEIQAGMRWAFEAQGLVVEGAAGVSIAAFHKQPPATGPAVVVLCGGNVDIAQFKKLVW
ncbi:MAG: threonine/serine dehydratase [Bacteroidota bacterium]